MKGQGEIVVFILLFLIGISLFSIAYLFSTGLFNKNLDFAKITSAENTMKTLNNQIQSVIGYGGSQSIDFPLNEDIEIINPQTLEIRFPVSVEISRFWVNISSQEGSYIRETLDENIFRIQLIYPETEYLKVELFSDTTVAKPSIITIEKSSTSETGGKPVIRIKLTFK